MMLKKLLLSAALAAALLVAPAQPSPLPRGPWWKDQAAVIRSEHLAMLNVTNLIGFGAKRAAASTPFWVNTYVDINNLSTYTFASVPLGTANSNRVVIVAVASFTATTVNATALTVGGVSATLLGQIATQGGTSLWWAEVPSGTTGDVVVSFSATQNHCRIGVWVSSEPRLQPHSVLSGGGVSSSFTLSNLKVDSTGFILLTTAIDSNVSISTTWTGSESVTERYEGALGDDNYRAWFADIETTTESLTQDLDYGYGGSTVSFNIAHSFVKAPETPYTPVLADTFNDGSNLTTYTFASKSIGTANADRLVVVAFAWEASGSRDVSSVTIAGVTASRVALTAGASGGAAIYEAAVASGTTGDVVITMSGSCNRLAGGVYDTRPALKSFVAAVTPATVAATSVTGSDLPTRKGGFIIAVGGSSTTAAATATYNGIDTLTTDANTSVEAVGSFILISGLTTEYVLTNDIGFSTAGSTTKRFVAASFL